MTRSPGPEVGFGRNFARWTIAAASLTLVLGLPFAAQAQLCSDATVPGVNVEYIEDDVLIEKPNSCNLLPCHKPEHLSTSAVGNELRVGLRFPGNHQFQTNNHVRFYWFNTPEPPPGNCLPPPYGTCSPIAVCGLLGAEILTDEGTATLQVSCPALAAAAGSKVFSISAYACQTFTGECTQKLDIPNLDAWNSVCRRPPCCEEGCGGCAVGGGAGGGPSGPGAPGAGRGATLRYRAGGAGEPLFPGAALWRGALGRYWSHDYAERIVLDPDASHVWLITQHATFREFTDADHNGFYERNQPTDEYRRLRQVAAGWELVSLDGTIQSFNTGGRWTRTEDAHGNAKTAFYSGSELVRVDMPDGRSETFSYHPDGKLATITETGVDGSTSRAWIYTWAGDDLTRIDAPDDRAWTFRYDDPRLPGYMTRMTLVGTDGSERVEGAWEYDTQGNLTRRWRGDASPAGSGAVDQTAYSYDNPYLPKQTQVTDPLGQVTTYTLGRDPVSQKPRVESVLGDCPACGLGSNSQHFYDDPAHPMLKTREVDGKGTVTLYTYDANGQMTSRTEAFGTALQRATTWEYNGPFPGLVTEIEQPSTSGTGSRRTLFAYDAQGSLLSQTQEGVEAGSAFRFTTDYRYKAAGQLEETDPPGYGTQDVTRFAFDPARGNLIPMTRTDPLIGATSFFYDPFNRRTAVTDPNGVRTLTSYDDLDRVSAVTQEGETPAESLTTRYEHNVFGDLVRTILPRGNLIEYGYDAAGRLISIEMKPDRTTPGERTFFTLDGYGHRIREDQQRWDGTAWVTDSTTAYEYSTRCHLDKILHSDGGITEHAYDCNGNLERVWDANHPSNNRANPATTSYQYDALNRMASVSQPWAGAGGGTAVTRYEHDVQDHLVKVTDAEGNVTRNIFSDRDLMTQQVSEVSGTTEYRYNEHGNLITETDARGITGTRTVDTLGRMTFVDYPEDALDTRYTYDDPLVSFSKGRLTAIIRNGGTVPYRYDRFGRVLQDGALTYGYDANGNRAEIGYPGGVTASYDFDFADREERLVLTEPGQATKTLAAGAAYLANGPLSSLILGNGLVESRSFDGRYLPSSIRVPGKLDWDYETDQVGNILAIQDALNPSQPRSYAYQDYIYFLTQGNGPWGHQAWTYDKIGNRLTQTEDGATESYTYSRNASGENNPKLTAVIPPAPTTVASYSYDAAGDQTYLVAADEKVRFSYSAERRLSQISRDAPAVSPALTRITYDGRGFLESATFSPGAGASFQARTWATYSSEGVLLHKLSETRPDSPKPRDEAARDTDSFVLYFAERPVALLETTSTATSGAPSTRDRRLLYLTTDHLGTPVLATNESGNSEWAGGFSPFGEDFSRAREAGLFLRFPGQWDDGTWASDSRRSDAYYNVYRWYQPEAGRYSTPDVIGILASLTHYVYAANSPLNLTDPDGRLPKPPDGKWCGSSLNDPAITIPKPDCKDCNKDKLKEAQKNVEGKRQRFCKEKRPATPAELSGARGGIDVDQGAKAWYVPQGDPCVDYCICAHEQDHLLRVKQSPYRDLPPAEIECIAYLIQLRCLRLFASGKMK